MRYSFYLLSGQLYLGGTTPNLILTTICTFVSIMPINLGILASSMWMSLFFGLGTVVNIKKSGNGH